MHLLVFLFLEVSQCCKRVNNVGQGRLGVCASSPLPNLLVFMKNKTGPVKSAKSDPPITVCGDTCCYLH